MLSYFLIQFLRFNSKYNTKYVLLSKFHIDLVNKMGHILSKRYWQQTFESLKFFTSIFFIKNLYNSVICTYDAARHLIMLFS